VGFAHFRHQSNFDDICLFMVEITLNKRGLLIFRLCSIEEEVSGRMDFDQNKSVTRFKIVFVLVSGKQ